MKEIGSEFWSMETSCEENTLFDDNLVFLMSGRTALDFILKDIKEKRKIKTAYLPSYCCHSMIMPFIDNGIKVDFYDVIPNPAKGLVSEINPDKIYDVVYVMDYFGFLNEDTGNNIKKTQKQGSLVIEDMTHSIFSKRTFKTDAEYSFASLRKWTSVADGGIARKEGGFSEKYLSLAKKEYIGMRIEATKSKEHYIKNGGNKTRFLELFRKAEALLDKDYAGYYAEKKTADKLKTLDIKYVCERRIKNAEILIRECKNLKFIDPLFEHTNKEEVPLFVPVLIQERLRDKLRDFLVKKDIYCPIHWSKTELHRISKNAEKIYDNILSLVCDQRYDEEDMYRIISSIKEFEAKECV